MRARPVLLLACVAASCVAAHCLLDPREPSILALPAPPSDSEAAAVPADVLEPRALETRVVVNAEEPLASAPSHDARSERCASAGFPEAPLLPDVAWFLAIDTSVLLLDPRAGDAEFARWYRDADGERLLRASFRVQRLYQANVLLGLRWLPRVDGDEERGALTREDAWLARRLSEVRETQLAFAPAGLRGEESDDELSLRFDRTREEDLALLACELDRAGWQEVKRLSAERFAAGRYKSRVFAEPIVPH